MAENTSVPELTPAAAQEALEVLTEQERLLRFKSFGAAEAMKLGDEWVATVAVSGLSNGEDHEIILRAFEQVLGIGAPRWNAPVA